MSLRYHNLDLFSLSLFLSPYPLIYLSIYLSMYTYMIKISGEVDKPTLKTDLMNISFFIEKRISSEFFQ